MWQCRFHRPGLSACAPASTFREPVYLQLLQQPQGNARPLSLQVLLQAPHGVWGMPARACNPASRAGLSCHRRTEWARSLASAWAGARPEADRSPAVLEHGVRVPEGRVEEVVPRRRTRVPQPGPVAEHPEVVPVEVEGVLLLRRAVGANPWPVVSTCRVPVSLGTVLHSDLTLTVPRAMARRPVLMPAVRVLLLRCVLGAAPRSRKVSVSVRHGHVVQSQTRSCIRSLSRRLDTWK